MDGDRQSPALELQRSSAGSDTTPDAATGAAARGGQWRSDHPVNLCLSIPLPFGRYYFTLVAGKERRSAERRTLERRKHPIATIGNMIVLFVLGTLLGLAGLGLVQLGTAYILKMFGYVVLPQ